MPNTLFISYSRKQQDKAIQLDNIKLKQFYWWMDYRIVGTVDWWKNICEAIEESYCMVALMSKTYTESVYCMGELEYALKLNKPLLCIMLEPGIEYPAALRDANIQYVEMFEWDLQTLVQTILESMYRVEVDYNNKVYHRDTSQRPYLRPDVPEPPAQATDEDQEIAAKVHNAQAVAAPRVRVGPAIVQATLALDEDEYQRVIDLLEPVRPFAKDSDQEIIHELLREARLGQEYDKIAALVGSRRLRKRGCTLYAQFREKYPDYPDERQLAATCATATVHPKPVGAKHVSPAAPTTPDVSAEAVRAILSEPFDWCEVPAGEFLYGNDKQITLPTFYMAKYPITYRQFQAFIDDREGFDDDRWWDGLAADADQRKQPGEQRWKVNDHPRERVSWYDAMAFTRWLSWKLGGGYAMDNISSWLVRLPTEFEWEKAARGTDGRIYPWGNSYIEGYANINETWNGVGKNYLERTTPVTEYPQGASPYGVFGMSGNVWEWCLTDYDNPQQRAGLENISSSARRVVRGGSFALNDLTVRAVDRDNNYPDSRNNLSGFRVLRPPSLET